MTRSAYLYDDEPDQIPANNLKSRAHALARLCQLGLRPTCDAARWCAITDRGVN